MCCAQTNNISSISSDRLFVLTLARYRRGDGTWTSKGIEGYI